jgi:hypothetical protein
MKLCLMILSYVIANRKITSFYNIGMLNRIYVNFIEFRMKGRGLYFTIVPTPIYGPIFFFQSRSGVDPDFLKRGDK